LGKSIEIIIEGQPLAQKRHKFGRGFVYDPSKKDKQNIIPFIRRKTGPDMPSDPVSVSIAFYMPIPKSYSKKKKALLSLEKTPHTNKPDIDNMMKLYFDCFDFDDKIIYKTKAEKTYSPRPRVEIVIDL
tara:strand:- start:1146 stop:1532 length:387 start_codon:yes stop_codon:yes gene_type:complete